MAIVKQKKKKKKRPEYSLQEIQQCIRDGDCHLTGSATMDAKEIFGILSTEGILEEVLAVKESDFQYSMPSLYNPDLWQDVYRKYVRCIDAYIKLQIDKSKGAVVISLHKWGKH